MTEPPRDPKESLFDKNLLQEILIAGLTIGLIVFGVWIYLLKVANMSAESARGYIMLLMVFMQNMHVLNCRSEKSSTFNISLGRNPLIVFTIVSAIILQVIVSEVPILSRFLQTTSVPVGDMLILFILSTIIILIMEIYKIIKYVPKKNTTLK